MGNEVGLNAAFSGSVGNHQGMTPELRQKFDEYYQAFQDSATGRNSGVLYGVFSDRNGPLCTSS